jgi:hypothetical protein
LKVLQIRHDDGFRNFLVGQRWRCPVFGARCLFTLPGPGVRWGQVAVVTGDSVKKAWDQHESLNDGRWNFDKVSADPSSAEFSDMSVRQDVVERMSGLVEQRENVKALQKTRLIFGWSVKFQKNRGRGISSLSIALSKTLWLSQHQHLHVEMVGCGHTF